MSESKENVPKIRFPGFSRVWEQRELGNLVKFFSGLTYSPDNVISEGGTFVLRSSNVKIGEIVDVDNVYVETEMANSDNVQIGDVIVVVRNGSRDLIGKHAQIKRQMADTVIGAFMTGIRSETPNFTNALLDTQQFSVEINKDLGATINQITTGSFKKMKFFVPGEKAEQEQVGAFFNQLDNLITLHQRKLNNIQNLKAGLLQKMFPKDGEDFPEVRFPGFTDAWEQRKIGEILTQKRHSIELEDNRIYELVTVRRRNEGVVSRGLFKGKDILVKNYFEVNAGDFIISKRQVIHGANGIVPQSLDRAIVSNEYLVVVGNENITTEFWTLVSRLPSMYNLYFLSSYGVDIEKLVFDVEDWKKRTIAIPKLSEQKTITEFFDNLDYLITLHQRKLKHLQEQKKSLLQQMFV